MDSQALPEATPTIDPASTRWEAGELAPKKTAEPGRETQETIAQRLARIRRERGLTQVELAQRLGVAQPVVSDYERGELRLHGQLIVKLSQILGVSSEELLGLKKAPSNGVLKNRRLLRRLQAIERLPRRDQQALLRTIDRFLDSFRAS
jgi:transcriptional regulator with XRE-family HTH domain